MADNAPCFDDGDAYERFMGRWSRAVGVQFLDWLTPPKRARWLDVGCGTGVFTQLVLDTCSPAAVMAVDPAPAQIEHARTLPAAVQKAEFRVADSQALPFPDDTFDVVGSALVINFIPDRPKALKEMARVARPGGMIAGYVWDFANDRSTSEPLRSGLRRIGVEPPATAGAADSTLEALGSLFSRAGLQDITARAIDVTNTFLNFDEFWRAQTPGFNPITSTIASLPTADQSRLMQIVKDELATGPGGSITYSARANAIKGRAPA
jgi:SAM-dependent methyltransferase